MQSHGGFGRFGSPNRGTMIRLYAIIFIVAVLGGVAYAAKYYYDTTQATIAQLRENNAKLEVANEENQATIKKMDENNKRLKSN